MDIYGTIMSPFTARVVMAARFKGIKHKMVMPKDGMKSPAFLKLNPFGKMPVIKDGGVTLFESAVIIEYLEAKYKKKRLVPAAAKAAGQARLIGAVFAEYVQGPVFPLFRHADPAKRDQAVVDTRMAELNTALDIAEKMISAKPYAAGAKVTIADCFAAPTLFWALTVLALFGAEKPLGTRKKLGKYWAKVQKDKVLGGVIKEMDTAYKQWRSQ